MSQVAPPRAKKLEGVDAPWPYLLEGPVYDGFVALRNEVREKTGVDFLARCGDIARTKGFTSTKAGVAQHSWHKTFRAFDYDQGQVGKNAVIVMHTINGRIFFRTFIRCRPGFEKNGTNISQLKIWVAGKQVAPPSGSWFDFTAAALRYGFNRVPAWRSWSGRAYSTTMEFWHYQKDEGLTWEEAMRIAYLPKGPTPVSVLHQTTIGLNDRGPLVGKFQDAMIKAGLLRAEDRDEVFDAPDYTAALEFQGEHGLVQDGRVGPKTWAKVDLVLKAA